MDVRVQVPTALDEDVAGALREAGASDVRAEPPAPGLDPITLTVAAVIGVTALGELVLRWKAKHRCQQVIDARGGRLETSVNCDVKDGRIVVLTSDGETVEIVEAPEGIDLGKVIEAAVGGGAEAVEQAATAAGATVGP